MFDIDQYERRNPLNVPPPQTFELYDAILPLKQWAVD